MKAFLTMAAVALAATALAADTEDSEVDPGTLRVDIGRLGVINSKSQEIWQKMRSDVDRREYEDPRRMSSNLRQVVWEFNELRETLCDDQFMVEQSCGEPYVPKWMYESRKKVPSLDELQARQNEVSDRVVGYWDAACERLKKVIDHSDAVAYCSVE